MNEILKGVVVEILVIGWDRKSRKSKGFILEKNFNMTNSIFKPFFDSDLSRR